MTVATMAPLRLTPSAKGSCVVPYFWDIRKEATKRGGREARSWYSRQRHALNNDR
jgi:hypothetical protein